MKIVSTVFCLTLVFLNTFAGMGLAEEKIRLCNGEWPPYFSQNLPHFGVGSRIVSEAFALEGITVEYGFFPWKRALILAQSGDWDGVVGYESNPEREEYFFASNPVWKAPWVFFHLKRRPLFWQKLEDLAPYRLGGTLAYMYTPEFLAAEKAGKIQIERVPSDEQNFKKLVSDRIDCFPQLLDVGYFQLRKLFDPPVVQAITHHPQSLGFHREHLLLNKTNKRNVRLLEAFNRGLLRLQESGKYDHYFMELRENMSQSSPPKPWD